LRLWSLNPKYLDSKGLVALWRETLLAQKVLLGETKGYKNHPQLIRFKEKKNSLYFIGAYLLAIFKEASNRGYSFDEKKILYKKEYKNKMTVTEGQLDFEFLHLKKKLKKRDLKKYQEVKKIMALETHPLFYVIKGDIESWEVL